MTDDDTYTDDDNLDTILMTAPDSDALCRQCGGDITSDGVSWQHVNTWITDHEARPLG
jgi:hypothetical protein